MLKLTWNDYDYIKTIEKVYTHPKDREGKKRVKEIRQKKREKCEKQISKKKDENWRKKCESRSEASTETSDDVSETRQFEM